MAAQTKCYAPRTYARSAEVALEAAVQEAIAMMRRAKDRDSARELAERAMADAARTAELLLGRA